MSKISFVYIMTNKTHSTLYTGMTTDLVRRVYEQREGLADGFTIKYCCTVLVYYETCGNPLAAAAREKQIKAGSRKKKIALIESINPNWLDLYENISR